MLELHFWPVTPLQVLMFQVVVGVVGVGVAELGVDHNLRELFEWNPHWTLRHQHSLHLLQDPSQQLQTGPPTEAFV